MKKIFITLIIGLSCQATMAQNPDLSSKIEDQVARLDRLLDLSEEQEQNIQVILVEAAAEFKALKDSAADDDRLRRLKAGTKAQIREQLNPEQLEILRQQKKERIEKRRQRQRVVTDHRDSKLTPAMKTERTSLTSS